MGTTCTERPAEGRQAYLDRRINNTPGQRVVKSALVGSIYYAAVEITDTDRPDTPYVTAFVSRAEYFGNEFCYKDMSECMGLSSIFCSCPVGILGALTPVDRLVAIGAFDETSATAAERWRQTCLGNARRPRLKDGDRIRTKRPLSFEGGLSGDTFIKVAQRGRRGLFREVRSGELVRLPSNLVRSAEILG